MGFLSDLTDDLIGATSKIISSPITIPQKVMDEISKAFDNSSSDKSWDELSVREKEAIIKEILNNTHSK